MWNKDEYFKVTFFNKVVLVMMIIFSLIALFMELKANDNKTNDNATLSWVNAKWSSEFIHNTINSCYMGTLRWILMTNTNLIGQAPPPEIQRKMLVHCFCVVDRVRSEYTIQQIIESGINVQSLFMTKALMCIRENNTLDGIAVMTPNNDNSTITPEKPKKDSDELLPSQPEKESSSDSETIFQG